MAGDEKPLSEIQWEAVDGNDPTTFHCDVYADRLDWYGESHHPLWKGWFDIGRQSFRDFLGSGAPPGVKFSGNAESRIREYLTGTMKIQAEDPSHEKPVRDPSPHPPRPARRRK